MTKRINKILWNGIEVPKASTQADGLDGLNLGELFIKNDPEEPGVYTRTTDGKVASLGGGIDKYLHRLFVAIDANGNEIAPNDLTTPIASVRVNYGLWTEQFLSAKGMNPDAGSGGGGGGATKLGGLINVTPDADLTHDKAKMLVLEAKSNLWTLKNLSDLVGGLDEAELAEYLTNNNYAKKGDIPSLSGYATEQWVLGKGYLTEHQDLSDYAKKTDIPTIPTKVSAFENDANYATTSDLDDRIDALVNGAPQAYDTLKEIADVLAGNVNSISDILTALGNKADKAITLSGYGITDAYTIAQIDGIVNGLSGNISTLQGYFTDGVANSAKKLATARTIWGQSFNGTGNVDGTIRINSQEDVFEAITIHNDWYTTDVFKYTDIRLLSYPTGTRGGAIRVGMGNYGMFNSMSFGKMENGDRYTPYIFIKSSGYVGIGTTSPSYLLDVNGTTRTTKLVIGNGSIEWDETNKGFKITGGLYTESYLSAKGANTNGGSSSGGGLIESLYRYADLGKTFSDTSNDTFNAYTINKINTDLGSRISVLEGKATNVSFTQSLTSGTQIGSISIDGVAKNIYAPTIPTTDINKGVTAYGWGNHANVGYLTSASSLAWGKITGTPTTISGYGITDALVAGGLYKGDWDTNKTNGSYYTHSASTNRPSVYGQMLVMRNGDTTCQLYVGYLSTDNMYWRGWYDAATGIMPWRKILDENNYTDYTYSKSTIDTKLSGYLPLSGGTIGDLLTIQSGRDAKLILNNTDGEQYNVISARENGVTYGYIKWGSDITEIGGLKDLKYNGNTLIHSGNIGSQSVASATKLQTARTIWGQSFDGSGNVSGDLSLGSGVIRSNNGHTMLSSNGYVLIGYETAANGYRTYIDGNDIYLRYGQSHSNGLILSNVGNVLIGTTTDSGYKLHVKSAATALMCESTASESSIYFSASSENAYRWAIGKGVWSIGGDFGIGEYNTAKKLFFRIAKNGNVGIGLSYTTAPSYKLDVSGVIHSTTGIFSDGYVSAKGQNTSSDMRLKNVLEDVVLGVKDIANAPSIRFAWKNGGGIDVGSSAQYWQGLLPDAVKERDGKLEMQYANIALLSAIAIAKRSENHEERINRLEKENLELRQRIVILEGGTYA